MMGCGRDVATAASAAATGLTPRGSSWLAMSKPSGTCKGMVMRTKEEALVSGAWGTASRAWVVLATAGSLTAQLTHMHTITSPSIRTERRSGGRRY